MITFGRNRSLGDRLHGSVRERSHGPDVGRPSRGQSSGRSIPRAAPACVEPLERRDLLSAVFPTNLEQYLVELVNRARADPPAEAARYGIALNEGVPAADTISTAPKQPLAINP